MNSEKDRRFGRREVLRFAVVTAASAVVSGKLFGQNKAESRGVRIRTKPLKREDLRSDARLAG